MFGCSCDQSQTNRSARASRRSADQPSHSVRLRSERDGRGLRVAVTGTRLSMAQCCVSWRLRAGFEESLGCPLGRAVRVSGWLELGHFDQGGELLAAGSAVDLMEPRASPERGAVLLDC